MANETLDPQRVRLFFRKADGARFLSHLDLAATFEYAVRRARLPVQLSEGFNPRAKISFAAPLAVGYIGEAEIMELALREPVAITRVCDSLRAALPAGIEILRAEDLAPGSKSAASRTASATYRVDIPCVEDLAARIDALLGQETIAIAEDRNGTVKHRDKRPLLLELWPVDDCSIRMTVRLDNEGSVRPEQILGMLGIDPQSARVTRERIRLQGEPEDG